MLQRTLPPSHPGEILKQIYMEPLELTIPALAENLGVSRRSLSQLIGGHMSISTEMAIRLSKAFNNSPQYWMNMQLDYDISSLENDRSFDNIQTYRSHNSLDETQYLLSTVNNSNSLEKSIRQAAQGNFKKINTKDIWKKTRF